MNKLNQYVNDIAPFYHVIGLELDIRYSQLKVIKTDTNLPGLTDKCQKMMEVWLDTDTHATWKKLCDALDEQGYHTLAESIRKKCFQRAS